MNIYPAIDLLSGQCVRLQKGLFDEITQYSNDPVLMADHFAKQGANELHIVDLDGAKQGFCAQFNLIVKIAKNTNLAIQVGGGIRTKEQIHSYLSNGIERVILGSIAISQTDEIIKWLQEFGSDRIVLAADIKINAQGDPQLNSLGWQKSESLNLWDFLDRYENTPLKHVLCTDINRDGTLKGPNLDLYAECARRYPHIEFQASGGIGNLEDLKNLSEIPVSGVIIGKAIYENKISLLEALRLYVC